MCDAHMSPTTAPAEGQDILILMSVCLSDGEEAERCMSESAVRLEALMPASSTGITWSHSVTGRLQAHPCAH